MMSQKVSVIGLCPDELPWLRMLVALLRHPDPTVPELARQALIYLSRPADAVLLPASEPQPMAL
jgi:hypothetical protein